MLQTSKRDARERCHWDRYVYAGLCPEGSNGYTRLENENMKPRLYAWDESKLIIVSRRSLGNLRSVDPPSTSSR